MSLDKANGRNGLRKFGAFSFNLEKKMLFRGDERVKLGPKASEVLKCLILREGEWVSRADLQQAVWPDQKNVLPNTMDRQIADLRKALRGSESDPENIETEYNRGWRFVVDAPQADDAIPQPEVTADRAPNKTGAAKGCIIGALVLMGIVAAVYWTKRPRRLRILAARQITTDGRLKWGPLLTDGDKIFFSEMFDGHVKTMSVSVSGGTAEPFRPSLTSPEADAVFRDISPDRRRLLIQVISDNSSLWICSKNGGPPELLGNGKAEAAWGPDGQSFFLASSNGLSFTTATGSSRTSHAEIRGEVRDPRWSPDGRRVRVSVWNSKLERYALWEIPAGVDNSASASPLLFDAPWASNGVWTRDGSEFIFEAGSKLQRDLWIHDEKGGSWDNARKPVQLTTGLGSWSWPAAADAAGVLYALKREERAELVKLDLQSHTWTTKWQDVPAYELDYSRDGKRAVYTRFPDHTLWVSNADGTGRRQLTDGRSEAHQPHWSPDGAWIAFMGIKADGAWRIFVMPQAGGVAKEILPGSGDQGVPTWSGDGQAIVFGEPLYRKDVSQMAIYQVTLATQMATKVENSNGLWSPRYSPDGHFLLALTADSNALEVLAKATPKWQRLVEMEGIDHASWGPDSQTIYFDARKDGRRSLYQFRMTDRRLSAVQDLSNFEWPGENWFGVDADGGRLGFRTKATDDLWELKYNYQ